MVQNMFSYVFHVADFKDFVFVWYIYILYIYILYTIAYIHLHLGSKFVVNVGKFYQFHGASYGKLGAHGSKSSPEALDIMSTTSALEVGKFPHGKPQGWHCWTPPFLCKQQKDGWMWFVLSFLNIFTRIQDFFNIILSVFQEFFWLGNFWHPQILKLFGVDDI